MGYVNYYSKLIRNYGQMTAPLINLTKNDVEFAWTAREQQALKQVKEAVLSAPVLVEPDPNKPYETEVDASGYAMGGELSQRDEYGRAHLVAFFCKKFVWPAERYPVHDKELMATVE